MTAPQSYELLDQGACRELLGLSHIARVAMSIGALPTIVPVTYVIDGDTVVFRVATGAELADVNDSVLAFEVGYIDPSGQGGWSVLAVGVANEISDLATRAALALRPHHPWVLAERDRLYRLTLDLVSGTRIIGQSEEQHS